MALPTYRELLDTYAPIANAKANAFKSANEATQQGFALSGVLQDKQQQRELMKAKIQELASRSKKEESGGGNTEVFDDKGNLLFSEPKYSRILTPTMQGIATPLAVSRDVKEAIDKQLNDKDVDKAKDMLGRGKRLQEATNDEIIEDPALLALFQEGVEAQIRGGVPTAYSSRLSRTDTLDQKVGRVEEWLRGGTLEAGDVQSILQQSSRISNRESLSAAMRYVAGVRAASEAVADEYSFSDPKLAQQAKAAGDKIICTFLSNEYGKPITPAQLNEPGIAAWLGIPSGHHPINPYPNQPGGKQPGQQPGQKQRKYPTAEQALDVSDSDSLTTGFEQGGK